MSLVITLLAACPLLQTGIRGAAGPPRPDLTGQVRASLEEARAAQGLVGLAVAILVDGKITEFTLGYENQEETIPVTGQTLFRWASISKPVTSIAAMQLVEKGQLDLDADVRTLVPEFPEKPWPVTSRQLMQHRGGIVHYTNGKVVVSQREYESDHPFADTILALDLFKESPLIAEPGTRHAYTTHGYMLLGAVVQRAGEAPFHAQVKERIAKPLGMTTFRPDYQWEPIEHRAIGYQKFGDTIIRSPDSDVSWKLPGGGYLSTIGDLARFAQGIAEEKLLSEESWRAMWTSQTAPEKEAGTIGYGLGFGINGKGDELRVSHSGSQSKTRTLMQVKPTSDRAVVLMTNSEWANLAPIATGIWEILDAQE
ncbi:D-alanyl-D-alanine carboxypeptidase precursor [Planctomycetes bacterium Poly30]|uniref:D-alanyl-D-alanine carboxypeptidase n=1 Tax=Saltatorellus ferox TaxID=2528018 RepID=A0A518EMT3_9BACT|nr:D-alanyl-D-alanine carboxypeptidase precursor [Planctomycetes bacterium Poly30]